MSLDTWLEVRVDTGAGEMVWMKLGHDVNITHNMIPIWRLVGAYEPLYESEGKVAGSVVHDLRAALAKMESDMPACRALNPANGWGDADRVLPIFREWIECCEKHPKATIRVCR